MVLAAWLKESLIKRAEKRGREAAARECLEADGQRRGDETLAQAVERIRKEKGNEPVTRLAAEAMPQAQQPANAL